VRLGRGGGGAAVCLWVGVPGWWPRLASPADNAEAVRPSLRLLSPPPARIGAARRGGLPGPDGPRPGFWAAGGGASPLPAALSLCARGEAGPWSGLGSESALDARCSVLEDWVDEDLGHHSVLAPFGVSVSC
jgi:hypothetical protein